MPFTVPAPLPSRKWQNLRSVVCLRQLWDDDEFFEFEAESNHPLAGGRQVVLVAVRRLFDKPVAPQPSQNSGDLTAVELGKPPPEIFVLYPTDSKFAADKSQQERFIIWIEEVEPPIGPCLFVNGS